MLSFWPEEFQPLASQAQVRFPLLVLPGVRLLARFCARAKTVAPVPWIAWICRSGVWTRFWSDGGHHHPFRSPILRIVMVEGCGGQTFGRSLSADASCGACDSFCLLGSDQTSIRAVARCGAGQFRPHPQLPEMYVDP